MTIIKAKIVEFDLRPHPNADTLSLAYIKGTGWQCVVKTEQFQNATLGLYLPIESYVPTTNPLFKFLDKKETGEPFRIKTIRLRGALSQGLLLPAPEGTQLGDDLTETLGITKYESPIPTNLRGAVIRSPGSFNKYNAAENWKNYPDVLEEGEVVEITEKIHGTLWRAGFVNDGKFNPDETPLLEFIVGSNSVAKDPNDTQNEYSKMANQLDLKNKLQHILESGLVGKPQHNFIIFGELYGHKIQNLHYGCKVNERRVALFDVMVDGKYLPWETMAQIAEILGVETVPLLYRGPYSLEVAQGLRDGTTVAGGGVHIREGVVITPVVERFHPDVGRVTIKMISDNYLEKQGKDPNATDYH